MTSAENFGQQFEGYIPVFRGIPNVSPSTALRGKSVGKHWSSSSSVARKFANPGSEVTYEHMGARGDTAQGTTLAGYVHPDDVVQPGTEEYEALVGARSMRVGETDNAPGAMIEDEVPIRDGATVHIVQTVHRKFVRGKESNALFKTLDAPVRKVV